MCGIAGIIGEPGSDNIVNMLQATRHRGPDDHGIYRGDDFSIGMNRLAIIDLSDAAHQPMYSDDGRYVMVYNGEVYNFKEERKRLISRGYNFKSGSDTEVVLNLFIEHGKECVQHMRGMYAFVVYDQATHTFFGARDRFGIKPFYYYHRNGKLIFCSEIKGMLTHPDIPRTLNGESLPYYTMLGYFPTPHTVIKNIFSLEPGCYFTYQNNTLEISRYWEMDDERLPENTSLKQQEAVEITRELVKSTIKEQLISDVPLGVFLSGGLDSSIIAAVMKETGSTVEDFSIGFEAHGHNIDETTDADITARFLRINHHKVIITGEDVKNDFDRFIEALDQPSSDGLNVYFVSKFARQKITVTLSGLGADELFFGYGWQFEILKNYRPSNIFLTLLLSILRKTNVRFPYRESVHTRAAFSDLVVMYTRANNIMTSEQISHILNIDARKYNDEFEQFLKPFYQRSKNSPANTISIFDQLMFMQARLRESDSTGMIHSLETRFPFVDHRIAEFVYTVPDRIKLGTNGHRLKNYTENTKVLLYQAFKDMLPPDFHERQKRGFLLPHKYWMENELSNMISETLSSNFLSAYLDSNVMDDYLKKFKSGEARWQKIWQLFILLYWCRKFNVS